MKTNPTIDYSRYFEFSSFVVNRSVSFVSKPGLPDWKQIPPSVSLLAEAIQPMPADRILVLGCHHGVLPIIWSSQLTDHRLVIMDYDQIALDCTSLSLKKNGVFNYLIPSEISLLPQEVHSFSKIALKLPKGRKVTRRWLIEAFHLLETGGELYLAGANDQGIQSSIKDSQDLFGNSVILGYRKGNRIARMRKEKENYSLPDWAYEPGIAPGTWLNFCINLSGRNFSIFSLPGIFSYDQLDEGTNLLINNLQIEPSSKILDIGCGYGILGLYAASQSSSSLIDLVDSNRWAVAAATKNCIENKLTNTQVFVSDLLSNIPKKRYNLIISNPPFHTGQEINYAIANSLIKQAYHALEPEGRLILVANQFIRYDYLMKEVFRNVVKLQQTKSYHLFSATKYT